MAGEKEIGLLTIRTGKQRNLPYALELGEMALTTDECRLFVGLPSSSIPASLVAGRRKATHPGSAEENVEVLTEFTPMHVANKILYRPVTVKVPRNNTKKVIIPNIERAFIDYTAYVLVRGNNPVTDPDRWFIETGSIHLASVDSTLIGYQNNNTNKPDGLVMIRADLNTVAREGSTITFSLVNDYDAEVTFEYIYRGWNIQTS